MEPDLSEDLCGYRKRLEFVLRHIRGQFAAHESGSIRILDVGCGTGAYLGIPLAKCGFEVTGVDTHEPSIATARRLASGVGNARFICGDVDTVGGDLFDVLILSEILEHVDNPKRVLLSSLVHLDLGGLVIVTIPNGYGEFEWDSWLYRTLGFERLVDPLRRRLCGKTVGSDDPASTENVENGHIQFFSMARIMNLFDEASLDLIEQQPSTLVSGPFVNLLFGRSATFIKWNASAANKLPARLSSGWFFALKKNSRIL